MSDQRSPRMGISVLPEPEWKPCRKCGSTKPADTECSRCGGHGLVTGGWGEPETCPNCGCSGIQYPPVCPECCGYRAEERRIPTGVVGTDPSPNQEKD